jgi:hypothetical protein
MVCAEIGRIQCIFKQQCYTAMIYNRTSRYSYKSAFLRLGLIHSNPSTSNTPRSVAG